MDIFYIRQGFIRPYMTAQVTDGAGVVVSLVTATSVTFKMISCATGLTVVSAAGIIFNAAQGLVRYGWQSADTALIGRYLALFEVTFSDGTVISFPTPDYIPVDISPAIPAP